LDGDYQVAVGGNSLKNATTGSTSNCAVGESSLVSLVNGAGNCAFGSSAASAYNANESFNIVIGDAVNGTAGESNVIRIGKASNQTGCLIAGISLAGGGAVLLGTPHQPVMVSSDGGMGTITAATDGQVLIGSTGGSPAWATITAGSNVTVTSASNSITIASTASGGTTWSEQTGTTQAMAVNHGYILNNAGVVTATLPATAALGDIVAVVGKGTGGWAIAQNSGQTIHFGNVNTTTGAGGSLASTNRYDSIELICSTANTDFVARNSIGNLTVV
jgi:hypothetical protein